MRSWEYFHSDNILLETSLSWLSDDIVRFKIEMGLMRNVQKCSHRFRWIFRTRHSTPSLSMTSLSLARIYCACTLLGRHVCKRVDVYIITLSCTWWIYALSEHLLVIKVIFFQWAEMMSLSDPCSLVILGKLLVETDNIVFNISEKKNRFWVHLGVCLLVCQWNIAYLWIFCRI